MEELTYDQLIICPYTDHVYAFKHLFQKIRIHSFLEFGLGRGTKYFLDCCDKVTSLEVILPNQTSDWYDRMVELFQGVPHWIPIKKIGSEWMQIAHLLSLAKKDPALYHRAYLRELKDLCDGLFAGNQFDLAFVDPGLYMRADLVNELFDRVPIIVAHDTNEGRLEYRWDKIQTPSNYEKIVFSQGCGVTFWVNKEREAVSLILRKASASV